MRDVVYALSKALISSLHPRMLLLTFIPLILTIIGAIVFLSFVFDPVHLWLRDAVFSDGQMHPLIKQWSGLWVGALKFVLIPYLVFSLLWPVFIAISISLTSLFLMPLVAKHIATRTFPDIERQGNTSWAQSMFIALKASLVFLLILLVGLPFQLIPGLGVLISIYATAYLFVKIMSYDCLSEFTSSGEYAAICATSSSEAWAIGLICATLSFIPPFILFLPVYAGLAFSYFYFRKLKSLRANQAKQQIIF
ncbi:MAG: EI24 domain-containing protein [Burkholderiaceae bacterium]|jgi:CysZ protein